MENPMKMDDLGIPLFVETSMTFHSKSFTLMAPMGPVPPDWASNVRPFAGLVHSRSHAEKKVDPLGELETLPWGQELTQFTR